jgi:hypothetical protein
VSWTLDPVATHYQVYRNSTNNSLTSVALTGWLTAKSFTDEFVTPGRDYFYWTRATVYPEGNSHSALGPGDGGWAALAAPGSVFATDGTIFDQVNLVWSTVSGAASYRVFGSASDDPDEAKVLSGWQADNEFVDANLQPNTVRYYWVQASPFTNGGRNSALSESDSGWYRTSAIFDCGFESGNLADWSSSQP